MTTAASATLSCPGAKKEPTLVSFSHPHQQVPVGISFVGLEIILVSYLGDLVKFHGLGWQNKRNWRYILTGDVSLRAIIRYISGEDVTSKMTIGQLVQQPGGYKAFVPNPFPTAGAAALDPEGSALLERANLSLGRLDGITELIPDLDFFIFMYVMKEAALSSQIEGTQATLADVVKSESKILTGLPADVADINLYIKAMNQGLERLRDFPLSLRLIREIHSTLLGSGARALGHVTPGEFRTTQNWIGGASPATARYVPPPPDKVPNALSELERFLHAEDNIPKLVKIGLAHAHFETIHPFVDGNGRTGRLLVTFFLCQQQVLRRPVLYLSEFFKENRDAYFDLLQEYHNKANTLDWLKFFLQGVAQVSEEAIVLSREIIKLRERDMAKVMALGRSADNGFKLLRHLFKSPIVAVKNVEAATGISRANANKMVNRFVEAEILFPMQEYVEYGRTFYYRDYWNLFAP